MKHKYNIVNLLTSIIGYRGLPFPGGFLPKRPVGNYRGEEFEGLNTAPAPRQEYVKGTRLYAQDLLGRWYFMPVYIKHPDIREAGHMLELPNAVMSIACSKNIVRTQLVGRKGSVKELIGLDDYKISIAAFIQSPDGSYPEQQITRMKELWQVNESVELVSAFTDLLLDEEDRVVLTSIEFPPTPGVEDGQAVRIECETDAAMNLIIQ